MDFIAELTPKTKEVSEGTWIFFVNGLASRTKSGTSVVLIILTSQRMEQDVHLTFTTTNNVAEYKAFLPRIRVATTIGPTSVKIHVDSQLVAHQNKGEFTSKKEM